MKRKIVHLLVAASILLGSCNLPDASPVLQTVPTEDPAQVALPTSTALPTATVAPTPTPTAAPAVQVRAADEKAALGDFAQARAEYQAALSVAQDDATRADAAFGSALATYNTGNLPTAIEELKAFIAAYPASPSVGVAWYYLAKAYEARQLHAETVQAYGKYLELRSGILDDLIYEKIADAYAALGDHVMAANAYSSALRGQAEPSVWLKLSMGKEQAAAGDHAGAISTYLDVYNTSANDYARAQANFLLGQSYLFLGESEQAYTRFLDSVNFFPQAYDSYSGLVELVNAGIPVDDVQRGIVDYNAGQYGLALDALTRHITTAAEKNPAAYHYRALTYRALQRYADAVADWDVVIENYRTTEWWPKAYDEKAYTQWAFMERYADAAETLKQFATRSPESAETADFLYEAGRIQERANLLTEAAKTWQMAIEIRPEAEISLQGLFMAGITQYRLKDYNAALAIFQRHMVLSTQPQELSAAYLWIGKCQFILGDASAAYQSWHQATQADPTGYYAERAGELLDGGEPFVSAQAYNLDYDLLAERVEAEAWMRVTFNLPADTDLASLGDLAGQTNIRRGAELWLLGERTAARDEFEIARASVASDALGSYRLMNYLLDLGVYRSAILTCRQVLDLAGLDDAGTLRAPTYFNHVRFGVYFKDQILAAAAQENLNPLLFLSVIRQESLFESFAESSVGARGLLQLMPATGQEVASLLNWPQNFTPDLLLLPVVNIPLGARYLARQREYFDGDLYAMLSAYNGGPGNTSYWKDLIDVDDPDLYLEVIRAEETRRYIRSIYEYYQIYKLLYEKPAG